MEIQTLAEQVNMHAYGYEIARLQALRTDLKGFKRTPGSNIFSAQTIFDDWAFHHGGRSELQFNIGAESRGGEPVIRFGIAFSFETSRSLPSIDVLLPKVALFNEYIRANFDTLSQYEMWHFQNGVRSPSHAVSCITPDLVRPGTFVFLGGWSQNVAVSHDDVLSTFDDLLPLYEFVESGSKGRTERSVFEFHAGNRDKKQRTTGNVAEKALSIDLRHNEIQEKLFQELSDEFGAENVGTEVQSGTGGRIDAVSRDSGGYTFYEIKVGKSMQLLIRQAVGQLFEYALWPGATRPKSLVVVGEPVLNELGKQYIRVLNASLPIRFSYRQVQVQ